MVDIGDLKSLVRIGRAGSSPVSGTKYLNIPKTLIEKCFFNSLKNYIKQLMLYILSIYSTQTYLLFCGI